MRNRVKSLNKSAGASKYALKVRQRKILAQKLGQPPNTPFPVLNSCVEMEYNFSYVRDSIDLVEEDEIIHMWGL